jgi:hypothetical protein
LATSPSDVSFRDALAGPVRIVFVSIAVYLLYAAVVEGLAMSGLLGRGPLRTQVGLAAGCAYALFHLRPADFPEPVPPPATSLHQ